jgi:hypothetical protein
MKIGIVWVVARGVLMARARVPRTGRVLPKEVLTVYGMEIEREFPWLLPQELLAVLLTEL